MNSSVITDEIRMLLDDISYILISGVIFLNLISRHITWFDSERFSVIQTFDDFFSMPFYVAGVIHESLNNEMQRFCRAKNPSLRVCSQHQASASYLPFLFT
jgi:hypothetical protein